MKKHAICILAHKNWEQLDDLIGVLDSQYSDVYLHIDKKRRDDFDRYAKNHEFKRHKNVFTIESRNVDWGGYSQLLVELALFKEVLKHGKKYSYVHLISGQDFPLKPISQIVKECEATSAEYLGFITGDNKNRYVRRLRYWNILVSKVRTSRICAYTRKAFLALQMIIGINRLKHCPLTFEVGANWMSIRIESLKYIVNEYPKYEKFFKHGISAEECYKQMILKTCPSAKIVNSCKRYVVFENMNPSPKTLTMDMLDQITASDAFFARKFDDKVDKKVRLEIKKRITQNI